MGSNIDFRQARFTQSAPSLGECPPETGREVAFAGRSNAGKSSAINTLTDNSKLARTSKTPGRTQLINFFDVGENQRLVDLPGYGYAKVGRDMKETWQRNLSEYLFERESLSGLILLMDIRHPMQEVDAMIINWAVEAEMPVHILLTKADKLKRGPANNTLLAVQNQMRAAGIADLVSAQCFSSLKQTGIDQLKAKLNAWLTLDEEEHSQIDGGPDTV